MPGGGGTQRLPRLVGIQKALELMTQGKELRPQQALDIGIIHDTAKDNEELISKAKEWINNNFKASQPWDERFQNPRRG